MPANHSLLEQQNHAQRERLTFIDFCLQYKGIVGRTDLMTRFGTAVASSTRDFALYRDLAPANLMLRHDNKRYYRTDSFQPLFRHDTRTVLEQLAASSESAPQDDALSNSYCFDASDLITPPHDVIAVLSRAIHLQQAVQVEYLSLSSGITSRILIPHSIVNNGQRWHVRGYCRKREAFLDFVCTRITDIKAINTSIVEHEQPLADHEWNQLLTLELIPHPGHQHPDAIALDFRMQSTVTGPVRTIRTQAARAGYLLQHWNVDCSPDHHLPAQQYHLWLRNVAAISTTQPLSNMTLAPGYASGRNTSE